MKTVAIVQSNYLPWKGYFDLINSVDEFILYDEVQYTRRDCGNRIAEAGWGREHWASIVHTLRARDTLRLGARSGG